MRGARRAAAAALVLVSATHAGVRELGAQTTAGNCATATFGGFSGEDACVKARDLFAFVMPQVGVALSGGNPVLGEGGTLGGWGKRALSLRVTADSSMTDCEWCSDSTRELDPGRAIEQCLCDRHRGRR